MTAQKEGWAHHSIAVFIAKIFSISGGELPRNRETGSSTSENAQKAKFAEINFYEVRAY
jgi:hypothetical protein